MNTLFTTCLTQASLFLFLTNGPFVSQTLGMNPENRFQIQTAFAYFGKTSIENTYDEYIGKYKLDIGEDKFFVLAYKEGRLLGELTGAGSIEIFPEEKNKDKFFAKAAPAQFTFLRDEKGKIDTLFIVITGKGEMRGKKIQ